MEHILENVFVLPPDTVLHCALAHEGYVVPEDFFMELDETLNEFKYYNNHGAMIKLPDDAAWLLKIFKCFIAYQNVLGIPYGKYYWTNITSTQFKTFRSSKSYGTSLFWTF